AGADPTALAYADLAAAAIAWASGDLHAAHDRAERCAGALAPTVPTLAATCDELSGDASAAMNDGAAARAAYERGLQLAKQSDSAEAATSLGLALAELDLHDGKLDQAAAEAGALEAQAAERGATSPEARAWVLVARVHVEQAASQQALDDLGHVKPETIEPLEVRLEHQLALGHVNVLLGDPDGMSQIDSARDEAERQGFPGLVLAARLAHLEAATATGDDVSRAQRELATDARAHGYALIAHLAETVADR
ncbi:MAG TPA: hypothetical protein VLX92_08780, partial [Kofleriaceae bacterium]|nr:hypothetical protein [Kofleriaceae bacterium]